MEEDRKYDFDLFVIGGGSGGISAATRAAKLGKKVAVADFVKPTPGGSAWGVGGTCVNVGCIPKKLMHYAALLGEARKDQEACGWGPAKEGPIDWEKMVDTVNNHVKSLNWGYRKLMNEASVKYYNSLATFVDAHTLELKDKKGKTERVTAENIIIAVGGRPNYLEVPGAREFCYTSDDLFWLKKAPGRTLVIGAGYIALECGGFLRGMGFDVDVLYREKILRAFDEDMAARVVTGMKEIGVKFLKGNATKFEKPGDKIITHLEVVEEPPEESHKGEDESQEALESMKIEEEKPKEPFVPKIIQKIEEYDTVLLAVSRHADTAGLNLKAAGVETVKSGKIPVNSHWQSSVPNIFALGDVTTISKELTPLASKEAVYLIEGLYSGNWRTIDYTTIATTVFTPLEYSACGLSEPDAIAKFGEAEIDVYHSSFAPLEWTYLESRPKNLCYCKIIVHISSRKVLGIHFVGPNAGEVMGGFAVVVRKGLTYEDMLDTIGIHPTTSEELLILEITKRENPDAEKKGC